MPFRRVAQGLCRTSAMGGKRMLAPLPVSGQRVALSEHGDDTPACPVPAKQSQASVQDCRDTRRRMAIARGERSRFAYHEAAAMHAAPPRWRALDLADVADIWLLLPKLPTVADSAADQLILKNLIGAPSLFIGRRRRSPSGGDCRPAGSAVVASATDCQKSCHGSRCKKLHQLSFLQNARTSAMGGKRTFRWSPPGAGTAPVSSLDWRKHFAPPPRNFG